MSQQDNPESHGPDQKSLARKEMSRRQFLSYTLGGAGAFMAGGTIIPMLSFAVDPLLKPKGDTAWVKVVEENKITDVPKSFSLKVHQIDGWYESDPEFAAWIAKDSAGKLYALSPVCKHLGCTIGDWAKDTPNEYVCPCHGARYNIDGKNLAVAPNPLDEYSIKVENGFIYLGQIKPNTRVKK